MPRRQRIHVPGGTYYIVRKTDSPYPIFSQPDDYTFLERLLPGVLRRTGASLIAYCWMPDAMHLAMQVDSAPVGDFMRELTSQFAQHVNQRTGERGQFFRRPYQSTLIDPVAYLLVLVSHLHHIPVSARLAQDPAEYPHSSHDAYSGGVTRPWLEKKPVLDLLHNSDCFNCSDRRMLTETPPEMIAALLEGSNRNSPGVLGGPEFLANVPRRRRAGPSKWSLDRVAAQVAMINDVSIAHLQSRSRRRELVVARAQLAWYATERRVATLTEVARYLSHSASSLTRAVTRHQIRQPELFKLGSFAPLVPLTPPSTNASAFNSETATPTKS